MCVSVPSWELSVSTRAYTISFAPIYLAVYLQHFVAVITLPYRCVCVYVCCCFLHSVIIRSLSRSRPVLSYSHPHPPSHLIQNVFEFIFVFAYFSCIYIKYLNLLPSHCACNPLMQITRA